MSGNVIGLTPAHKRDWKVGMRWEQPSGQGEPFQSLYESLRHKVIVTILQFIKSGDFRFLKHMFIITTKKEFHFYGICRTAPGNGSENSQGDKFL